MQDNEESINSRGQGCGGGEHQSLQHCIDSKGWPPGTCPISSDPCWSPERKVGQVLPLSFIDVETGAEAKGISSLCFIQSIFHSRPYPPSLTHLLVIPSLRHSLEHMYPLNKHPLSTNSVPGQIQRRQRAVDPGPSWKGTQQRAVTQKGLKHSSNPSFSG